MTAAPVATDARPVLRRTSRAARPGAIDWVVVTQLLAALGAFTIPARLTLINGVDVGTLVAIGLFPVWWGHLRTYRGARLVMAIGALALASGLVLTFFFPGEREFNRALLQGEIGVFLLLWLGIGVLLWARTVLGGPWTVVWFGLGNVVAGVLHPTGLGLPWKYDFGVPITLIVLALAARRGPRPLVEVPAALVMAAVFAVNDSRSIFGLVVLAAMVGVLQAFLPAGSGRVRDLLAPLAGLAVAGFAVYRAAMGAIESGLLGEAARQRTLAQLQSSGGSLLAGGRPEMGASLRLIETRPWGYGNGLMASRVDFAGANLGMAEVSGRIPDEGYVQNYMFHYGYVLHSTLAEFWVKYGIAGMLLLAAIAVLTVVGLLHLLARRRLSVMVMFLAVNSLWNLLFSPTQDTIYLLALTVALTAVPRLFRVEEEDDPRTRVGSPLERERSRAGLPRVAAPGG